MNTGSELIAKERARQRLVKGYDDAHDDKHDTNELVQAAICYAQHSTKFCVGGEEVPWPWNTETWNAPDDPIEALAKAGALIAAEIDRLQRLGAVKG